MGTLSRRAAGHAAPGSRANGVNSGLSQVRRRAEKARIAAEEAAARGMLLDVEQSFAAATSPTADALARIHARCLWQNCPECGAELLPIWNFTATDGRYVCRHHRCPDLTCPNGGGLRKPSKLRNRLRMIEELEERDGEGCFYCGLILNVLDYTFDHYIPRAAGGTREFSNLRLACKPCNGAKGDMHPAEFERLLLADLGTGDSSWLGKNG